MSCKYCTPRDPEPLSTLPEVRITRTSHATTLTLDSTPIANIDYCPICGESLLPFGPAWARAGREYLT